MNESARDWGQSQVNPTAEWMESQKPKAAFDEHLPNRNCDCPECIAYYDENTFLTDLQHWLVACFGREVAQDRTIRNHRFFEEACELVQAGDMTRYEAYALVDAVFSRPKGQKVQEVGGVMTTLGAWCLANGIPMWIAARQELASVWHRIPQIQARQSKKIKPVPGDPPAGAFVLIDYTNYRGERGKRTITPKYLRFGSTSYHPEPQWLVEAVDVEKGPRSFAVRDIHSWIPYPADAPLSTNQVAGLELGQGVRIVPD